MSARDATEFKLASPGHAAAGSSKIGKISQTATLFINRSSNSAGGFRIVAIDPLANAL
jgi:hypothetical protein